ncbi:hypothetical protein CHR52_19850 [Mycobacterium tuberculosis]|nr:hypothetical protein CHR52_19850 [Mycobacterium tuberculosis]AVO13985.1 hypothetical protein CHR51_20540 [Mycobacterium tuberculosis]
MQVGQGGGDHDRDGKTVVLAQFPGGDQRAQPGQQPVVVALGLAAGVAVDGGRIGGGVDDRGVVVGVGRAGGAQFG